MDFIEEIEKNEKTKEVKTEIIEKTKNFVKEEKTNEEENDTENSDEDSHIKKSDL